MGPGMQTTTTVFTAQAFNEDTVSTKKQEVVTEKEKRMSYRQDPGYKFTLRIQVKRGEPRIVVRVYEAERGSRTRLTAQVFLGSFEVFPRGRLVIENSTPWKSEEEARIAVLGMLSATPTSAPKGFFQGLSAMQSGFFHEYSAVIRRAAWLRFGTSTLLPPLTPSLD